MSDKYQPLRDALAAGVTPGPWFAVNDGTEDEPMMSVKAARIAGQKPRHVVAICATGDSPQRMEDANAALIAAADPDTIAALLKERDALLAIRNDTLLAVRNHTLETAALICDAREHRAGTSQAQACYRLMAKDIRALKRAALTDGEAQS